MILIGLDYLNVQMLGLNVYSYIDDVDMQFYNTQKVLAKMDILDKILGSYVKDTLENPLDRARRLNPEEGAIRATAGLALELLVQLHSGTTSRVVVDEEEEERGNVEEGATGFMQESEAPQ